MRFVDSRLLYIFFIVFTASSCSLDAECINQREVPIIRFEMPDSLPVDSLIDINVIYVTYSNCSKLNSLQDFYLADTITLRVIADYNGCTCPETLPDSVVAYYFKSSVKRNYIFRGIKYDNTILQDTLRVY